jgi:hypothetical protein
MHGTSQRFVRSLLVRAVYHALKVLQLMAADRRQFLSTSRVPRSTAIAMMFST